MMGKYKNKNKYSDKLNRKKLYTILHSMQPNGCVFAQIVYNSQTILLFRKSIFPCAGATGPVSQGGFILVSVVWLPGWWVDQVERPTKMAVKEAWVRFPPAPPWKEAWNTYSKPLLCAYEQVLSSRRSPRFGEGRPSPAHLVLS